MTASADPPHAAGSAGADVLPRFLAQLGHAPFASGEAVAASEDLLRRIASAHGVPRCNVVVLPTVLFVKLDDGVAARLDFTSEEGVALTFDQIDQLFALARDAEARALTPAQRLARLQAILAARAKPAAHRRTGPPSATRGPPRTTPGRRAPANASTRRDLAVARATPVPGTSVAPQRPLIVRESATEHRNPSDLRPRNLRLARAGRPPRGANAGRYVSGSCRVG